MTRFLGLCISAAAISASGVRSPFARADDPPKSNKPPAKAEETRGDAKQPRGRGRPSLRLDLTPGVDELLITDQVVDDGITVPAAEGKVFVLLPARYDANAGPAAFSGNVLRGVDGRGFYGFRVLQVRDGRPVMPETGPEPIYERIELKEPGAGRNSLSARNILGPRRNEKGKPRQDHLQDRPQSLAGWGWLVIVLEVSKWDDQLRLQWSDKHEDEVDLGFLRQIPKGLPREELRDPSSKAISTMVRQIENPCPAMSALAIRRLTLARREQASDQPSDWFEKVDAKVLPAAARPEADVREAVWNYVASYPRLSDAAVRLIAKAKPPVARHWIRLAEAGFSGELDRNPVVATQVLGAALRSTDQGVCEAAWRALTTPGSNIDWSLLGGFSRNARALALARLGEERDKSASAGLLAALVRQVRPEDAASIAAQAEKMGIRLFWPNDPVLAQWRNAKNAEHRVALLTILAALDLGDVIYAEPTAEMLDQATAAGVERSVREAGFRLVIRQIERSLRASDSARGAVEGAGLRGQFPVRAADQSRDPLVQGLVRAAAGGSEETRLDALARLLQAGYADEACRAFVAGAGDNEAVLKKLLQRGDAGSCLGSFAMLGRLLCQEHARLDGVILEHWDRVAETLPETEQWQICAAVKAEVDLIRWPAQLNAAATTRWPSLRRWLRVMGHFTGQDGQRLAASSSEEDWDERLRRIDARRAVLLDARYGVFAVLETSVCEEAQRAEPPAGQGDDAESARPVSRWSVPRRITVALPVVKIESNESDNKYRVLWGKRSLGEGMVKTGASDPRPPFSPGLKLTAASESMLGPEGWGWRGLVIPGPKGKPEQRFERAVGPAVLPSGEMVSSPQPDQMVLDVGAYLRMSLPQADDGEMMIGDPREWVPKKLPIVLHYTAFGGFRGMATQAPFPARSKPGQKHLLNVAIILERID